MSERRSVEFPTYHYTSVTDPQTGKQKPYMPTEMLAAPATPPPSGDVEAAREHAGWHESGCATCAALDPLLVALNDTEHVDGMERDLIVRLAGGAIDAIRAEAGTLDVRTDGDGYEVRVWQTHQPSGVVVLKGHPQLGGRYCLTDGGDWPCATARGAIARLAEDADKP